MMLVLKVLYTWLMLEIVKFPMLVAEKRRSEPSMLSLLRREFSVMRVSLTGKVLGKFAWRY